MASAEALNVVEIDQLSHAYRSRGRSFEVTARSLRIAPARFYAMVGPSGSGKSTLLDMLALVRRPQQVARFAFAPRPGAPPADVRAAWALGDDGALADLRRVGVGYVLQTGGLLPFLSTGENVRLPIELAGRRASVRESARLLEEFGVGAHERMRVNHLSGGERQRVAIARALAHRPSLVLADEPTAAVDRDLARAIVESFAARAREGGAAVVMVTHDEALVSGVADVMIRLVRTHQRENAVRYEARGEGA